MPKSGFHVLVRKLPVSSPVFKAASTARPGVPARLLLCLSSAGPAVAAVLIVRIHPLLQMMTKLRRLQVFVCRYHRLWSMHPDLQYQIRLSQSLVACFLKTSRLIQCHRNSNLLEVSASMSQPPMTGQKLTAMQPCSVPRIVLYRSEVYTRSSGGSGFI